MREYVAVARELETGAAYSPRAGPLAGRYSGPLWRFVEQNVPEAFQRGLSVREGCNRWYSGAYLMETVPSVLYILMRHAQDFDEAVVRAVNDTKDNDTIAAIVGAAAGYSSGHPGVQPQTKARQGGGLGAFKEFMSQEELRRSREKD